MITTIQYCLSYPFYLFLLLMTGLLNFLNKVFICSSKKKKIKVEPKKDNSSSSEEEYDTDDSYMTSDDETYNKNEIRKRSNIKKTTWV